MAKDRLRIIIFFKTYALTLNEIFLIIFRQAVELAGDAVRVRQPNRPVLTLYPAGAAEAGDVAFFGYSFSIHFIACMKVKFWVFITKSIMSVPAPQE